MKRTNKWLSASLAAVTVTALLGMVDGAAIAGQAGPGGPRGAQWGMGGPGPGPGIERFAKQLSLTDAQKASIRDVVKQSRQAALANGGGTPPDLAALLIPTNSGHANAVAAAKQRASDRVDQMLQTEAKIYALLTPEQQAQLANLIASRPQRPAGPRR